MNWNTVRVIIRTPFCPLFLITVLFNPGIIVFLPAAIGIGVALAWAISNLESEQ